MTLGDRNWQQLNVKFLVKCNKIATEHFLNAVSDGGSYLNLSQK
jgi:hypothetical protein